MIRVNRGPEPSDLPAVREASLQVGLAKHANSQTINREKDLPPTYRDFEATLWLAQHLKCAYCESVEQAKRNDVEHYRPAGRAIRAKGEEAAGYWWLAYTWSNLLFSCRNCNQAGAKHDWFPLEAGSVPLAPLEQPPGREFPTLIDPSTDSPLDHIEFTLQSGSTRQRWLPRGRTERGQRTVDILKLHSMSLLELYSQHVESTVQRAVRQFMSRRLSKDELCDWLLHPRAAFVALSVAAVAQLLAVPADQFLSAAKKRGC